MVGDPGSGGLDDPDIGIDLAQDAPADVADEEGLDHPHEGAGDVVFSMKLGFIEDGDEDVFRQDVLDDHLPDVGHDDVGVDGIPAEFQKISACFGEGCILGRLVFDQPPEFHDQIGKILFESFNRLTEGPDLLGFVVDKGCDQAIEGGVVVEGNPLQLPAVPDEDGGSAVLEEDIGRGVTFGKFLLNLVVKGIFLVFALPVSPVLTKGVFQRAVRIDGCAECGPVLQL